MIYNRRPSLLASPARARARARSLRPSIVASHLCLFRSLAREFWVQVFREKLDTTWGRQKRVGIVQFSGTFFSGQGGRGARPAICCTREKSENTFRDPRHMARGGRRIYLHGKNILRPLFEEEEEAKRRWRRTSISTVYFMAGTRGSNAAQQEGRARRLRATGEDSWDSFELWWFLSGSNRKSNRWLTQRLELPKWKTKHFVFLVKRIKKNYISLFL